MNTAPSFLGFAAIQGIERKQNLADLAPKGCFISAEAVERAIGQIGETQEAACELDGMRDVRLNRFRPKLTTPSETLCSEIALRLE